MRRGGQRRRGAPRSSGSAWTALFSADLAGALEPLHRGRATRSADRRPSRALADCPGRPVGGVAEPGPVRRGGRRRPPRPGHGPGARLPGRGGAGPGGPQPRRLRRRRPERRRAAGPAGRADHGRHPRLDSPACAATVLTDVLIRAGDLAAAERVCAAGLAQSRDAGDLWNLASLLPKMATLDLQAGRAEDAAAHLREALQIAVRTGAMGDAARRPGLLRAPVRRDRAPRRGPHGVGRGTPRSCQHEGTRTASRVRHRRQEPLRAGPAGARARPDAGGRGARRGDEPGHRGRVRPDAHRPRPAAAAGAAGSREAQRPGTGAGHPGRPGPHRRPDRRPAVHQRPHGPLPPGPDPGQDRLPPPRRPDPPGPEPRAWSRQASQPWHQCGGACG